MGTILGTMLKIGYLTQLHNENNCLSLTSFLKPQNNPCRALLDLVSKPIGPLANIKFQIKLTSLGLSVFMHTTVKMSCYY